MMRISVNGQVHDLPAPQTIDSLLQLTGHAGRRVAVEVNSDIIPRGRHASHPLEDGDRVEVIQAIGGG